MHIVEDDQQPIDVYFQATHSVDRVRKIPLKHLDAIWFTFRKM